MKQSVTQGVILKPGECVPATFLQQLAKANEHLTKTKNRGQYLADLKALFNLEGDLHITTESKLFLGGFIEGEGSLNVSCKKLQTAKFGVLVDPEFTITQHVNGFLTLYLALNVFNAGRISFKSGSNATLVFKIDNRRTLEEKVLPFFDNYVVPYGSPEKIRRLDQFRCLLEEFNNNAHTNLDPFVNKILPIWDSMRKQVGQSNQTFANLQEAQQFAIAFSREKRK